MKIYKFTIVLLTVFLTFLLFVSADTISPLEKTKLNIEKSDFTVNINNTNTEDSIKEHLINFTSSFAESGVEIPDVNITEFEPAIIGEKDGSFSFTVELIYKNHRITTNTLKGVIICKPVFLTAVSTHGNISEGDECTIVAEISDYDGSDVIWFESNSKNRVGVQLDEKSNILTISPDVGTKYYYCTYNGAVSNRVTVTVSEPFVPISDITLGDLSFICGVPVILNAEITPNNSTLDDVTWKIISGEAFVSSNKITAKQSGIITVEARVNGGGENGEDYVKLFEFYAEENKDPSMQISWDAYPISPKGITAVTFISNEKKDVQVTSLSSITTDNALKTANIPDKTVLATAHITNGDITDVSSVTLQLEGKYASKQVNVVSIDNSGNVKCINTSVSDTGALDVPAGNVSYIITLQSDSVADLSFLFIIIPIIPLIFIPIFVHMRKKDQ